MKPDYRGLTMLWVCVALALLLIFLSLGKAHAAETWLVSTVHSYHYERGGHPDRCEDNWGIGVEHYFTQDWAFMAGGYRNSYCDRSIAVGGMWMPLHRGYFHFGLVGGAVTGYDKKVGGYLIPTMMIQNKHVGLNIGVVPSTDRAFTVIGFQVKVRVW